MDFGQLSRNRPFDPSLPPLHSGSEVVLSKHVPLVPEVLPLHLGAPQWTMPDHCRTLADYAKTWDSIELNTAFYRTATPEGARAWAEETPADFRFFVKLHQDLSHEFSLWNDHRLMAERMHAYVTGWRGLGEKWAGSFLQLPPGLGIERLELLRAWLANWNGPPLFVEFRNENWFEGRQLKREAARVLAMAGAGTVCTDTPGRRDASHGTLTTPDLFVRFLGQSLVTDASPLTIDLERLDEWAERIETLRAKGLRSVAFFLHTPDLVWVPELTRVFAVKLADYGFPVRSAPGPRAGAPQLSLF